METAGVVQQVGQPMSFLEAMRLHFGLKPGQVLKEFFTEIKALTDAEREEIKQGLIKLGYVFK